MRTFLIFLSIAVLSYLAGIWYPWWSVAIVAFVVILLAPLPPWGAFITGFLAVFLLWGTLAFYQALMNDYILAGRMARLFVHRDATVVLLVITGAVGGLAAGFAALAAACLRSRPRPAVPAYR